MTDKKKEDGQQEDKKKVDQTIKKPDEKKDDSGKKKDEPKTVPLADFLKMKENVKVMKTKLTDFESADKKRKEEKMLEDKKYLELIKTKEDEILKLQEVAKDNTKKLKKTALKNKALSKANKENAIDGEDILKFMNFDDLLDKEDYENRIEFQIKELKEKKPHLFGDGSKKSKNDENGIPFNGKSKDAKNKGSGNPILDMLNNC